MMGELPFYLLGLYLDWWPDFISEVAGS